MAPVRTSKLLHAIVLTVFWSAPAFADPGPDAAAQSKTAEPAPAPAATAAAAPAELQPAAAPSPELPPAPPPASGAPVQAPAQATLAAPSTPARSAQPPPKLALVGKPWEQTSSGDGIVTYKREVPGSDIIALRGVATVAAPIERVASVLLDYSRSQEWIDDLELVRVIRWVGPAEFIEYDRLGTPPIIMKDRDFVCRGRLWLDARERTMVMTVEPAVDPRAPPYDDFVRGELRGYWKLKSIDNGQHTLIVAEMHGDPKGGVPKWLVNLFQKGWARSTVESLRKQVAKPDIQVMPQIKAAFEGKPFVFAIKSK
jgi:hypothetical protein